MTGRIITQSLTLNRSASQITKPKVYVNRPSGGQYGEGIVQILVKPPLGLGWLRKALPQQDFSKSLKSMIFGSNFILGYFCNLRVCIHVTKAKLYSSVFPLFVSQVK